MKIPGILWVIPCVIFLRLKTRTVDFVLFIFLFLGECGSQVFSHNALWIERFKGVVTLEVQKQGKSSRSKDVYDLYTKEIPRILAFIVVHIVFFLFLKIENTWSWNILQDIPNTNARYNQENGKKLWIVLYLRDLWRLLTIYFSYELKMGRIWCQTQRKVKEIQMNHQPILLLMHLNICKL